MISAKNDKIYNIALILKVKKQMGLKKIKNIIKNLRSLAEEDLRRLSMLKVKVFDEDKKDNNKSELKIVAPITGFQHYLQNFNKSNSKSIVNNSVDFGGKNIPSNVDDNEEEEQIDSSDFSED